jgi:hypothetical protein
MKALLFVMAVFWICSILSMMHYVSKVTSPKATGTRLSKYIKCLRVSVTLFFVCTVINFILIGLINWY